MRRAGLAGRAVMRRRGGGIRLRGGQARGGPGRCGGPGGRGAGRGPDPTRRRWQVVAGGGGAGDRFRPCRLVHGRRRRRPGRGFRACGRRRRFWRGGLGRRFGRRTRPPDRPAVAERPGALLEPRLCGSGPVGRPGGFLCLGAGGGRGRLDLRLFDQYRCAAAEDRLRRGCRRFRRGRLRRGGDLAAGFGAAVLPAVSAASGDAGTAGSTPLPGRVSSGRGARKIVAGFDNSLGRGVPAEDF